MNGPQGSYSLDVLGQRPELHVYTQICSCFSLTDTSSHSVIINILTHGLERLSANFPWVAGQIVNEGASDENSGIFTIEPLEKIPRLVVKDLRELHLAEAFQEVTTNLHPIQNQSSFSKLPFITGRLLLTFLGQHRVMNMAGQGQIMACQKLAAMNNSQPKNCHLAT